MTKPLAHPAFGHGAHDGDRDQQVERRPGKRRQLVMRKRECHKREHGRGHAGNAESDGGDEQHGEDVEQPPTVEPRGR